MQIIVCIVVHKRDLLKLVTPVFILVHGVKVAAVYNKTCVG
jgi:hypothetical protein